MKYKRSLELKDFGGKDKIYLIEFHINIKGVSGGIEYS